MAPEGVPVGESRESRDDEGEDFSASFRELREAVADACGSGGDWVEGIVAGISATLEFAAANPTKAEALTLKARRTAGRHQLDDREVLEFFTDLLEEAAPPDVRWSVSTDRGIVESIAAFVRGHLVAGTAEELPAAAADFSYLVLLPYLGAGTS
jgi:hypothetical protein